MQIAQSRSGQNCGRNLRGGQAQIAFTGQRTVPVVKVGDEWRLDSGPICVWLDKHFADHPIAGSDPNERRAIEKADEWVTDNIIGLLFRSTIDDDRPFSAFRNGRVLANVMRQTSGQVPWWTQFIWYRLLRQTRFVVADANKVDRSLRMQECREGILSELESRLSATGFLAGTNRPSYADMSLFAQLACASSFGLEGALAPNASEMLRKWYHGICDRIDTAKAPELVPGHKVYGFGHS